MSYVWLAKTPSRGLAESVKGDYGPKALSAAQPSHGNPDQCLLQLFKACSEAC